MFIDGFGISGYRSFGSEHQFIGPCEKINLLIGQNNSGKSNILTFLKNHYNAVIGSINDGSQLNFTNLDRHIGSGSESMKVSFGFKTKSNKAYNSFLQQHGKVKTIIEQIVNTNISGEDLALFTFNSAGFNHRFQLEIEINNIKRNTKLGNNEWSQVWQTLTGRGAGNLDQHWIPETMHPLSRLAMRPIKVDIIPAIRSVGQMDSQPSDYSGIGIIERLAKLQNPTHESQADKKHFAMINEFLRSVVGNNTATLEVPFDRAFTWMARLFP